MNIDRIINLHTQATSLTELGISVLPRRQTRLRNLVAVQYIL